MHAYLGAVRENTPACTMGNVEWCGSLCEHTLELRPIFPAVKTFGAWLLRRTRIRCGSRTIGAALALGSMLLCGPPMRYVRVRRSHRQATRGTARWFGDASEPVWRKLCGECRADFWPASARPSSRRRRSEGKEKMKDKRLLRPSRRRRPQRQESGRSSSRPFAKPLPENGSAVYWL